MRNVRPSSPLMVALMCALLAPAEAGEAPRLSAYLKLQRGLYPQATVTGRFSDWRTVSRYRRHAGLHYGYDVAMAAGSTVVAGWPGRVTTIVNWCGEEYGITVTSPDGYETTYGHISTLVKPGQWVEGGEAVGRVVRDHVDIKMRDASGSYYDFGDDCPGPAPAPAEPRVSRADWERETALAEKLRALESQGVQALEAAQARTREARNLSEALATLVERGAASAEEGRKARQAWRSELGSCRERADEVDQVRRRRRAAEERVRLLGSQLGLAGAPATVPVPQPPRTARPDYQRLYERGAISRCEYEATLKGEK